MMSSTLIGKININKIIDAVAFFIIGLHLTELFRFTLFVGVPLSVMAALTVFFLGLHFLVNITVFSKLPNKLVFGVFFTLMLGMPVALMPYHVFSSYMSYGQLVRVFANNLLFLLLACSTFILVVKYSYGCTRRWFYVMLGFILVGFALNYIDPGLFYALKLAIWGIEKNIEGLEYASVERVGGFYLKSTHASASLVMMLPVGIYFLTKESFIRALLTYLFFLTLIFLTGSRSGLVIVLFLAIFFVVPFFEFFRKKFKARKIQSIELGSVFLPGALVLVIGVMVSASFLIPQTQRTALLKRAETLLSIDEITGARSMGQRTGAQLIYLEKIIDNPLFGYGATYREALRRSGEFTFSSHNTYIEMTFFYGVAYLLLLLFMIILLMSNKWKHTIVGVPGMNYMQLFGACLLLYCLFANTILQNRTFCFVLGVLLGVAHKKITNNRLV